MEDNKCIMVEFKKRHPDAMQPSKAMDNDVGYDIFAVEKMKQDTDIHWFDTGISVKPMDGYYVELVPRSSMALSGYMLVSSIGIIDPNYRGSIKIPLYKYDKNKPDLTPPFRICQLVIRRHYNATFIEASQLDRTARGSLGFGSTGSD